MRRDAQIERELFGEISEALARVITDLRKYDCCTKAPFCANCFRTAMGSMYLLGVKSGIANWSDELEPA